MSKEYDKQHFVPQSYLRRFARPNKYNKGYHIGVRRVTSNETRLFIKDISDVAYIQNYYDVSTRDDPKYWEHYFSQNIETLLGSPLSNIEAKIMLSVPGKAVLDKKDRKILASIISFQYSRIPAFLDPHLKKGVVLGKELKEWVLQTYGHLMSLEQFTRVSQMRIDLDIIKDYVLDSISSNERIDKYSEILMERIWAVYYNNTSIPFFTSDNPVIMYNFRSNSISYSETGIARADTIIYFPISSRIMVQLFPSNLLNRSREKIDGFRLCLGKRDLNFVTGVNTLQMNHASSETYMDPLFLEIVKCYDKENPIN